eukprot:GDKI01017021.1.p1 GENE.GDKI01017021.1~~GDKI01017021.1.p1  ORF type:complete len:381 (+),score=137.45 GDKI01017021.1:99-1241(+)
MSSQTGDKAKQPEPAVSVLGKRIPMKYVSLLLLVFQTTAVIVTTRFSRSGSSGTKYLNTTAVVFSELVKLVSCVGLVWWENGYDVSKTLQQINREIIQRPTETFLVGIPAFLYTLQNNLLFVAMSNLSGAMYQVTYQLKTLTTALLSVLMLQKVLGPVKWFSLVLLTAGVTLIQMPSSSFSSGSSSASTTPLPSVAPDAADLTKPAMNTVVGLVAVLSACMTSGFAGVYFEKILKQSKVSIWMRNIQLGFYGTVLGLAGALMYDWVPITQGGFCQGYNATVWSVIMLQAVGGLVVAAVLKYADNILKCFGNATSIVLTCVLSYYAIGDFTPSFLFGIGTLLVIIATYLYGVEVPLDTQKLVQMVQMVRMQGDSWGEKQIV